MTNKKKILIGAGAGVGLIGLYLFLNRKKNPTPKPKGCPDGTTDINGACVPMLPPNPNPPNPAPNDSGYGGVYSNDPHVTEQTCLSYKVSTSSSNLNVRSQPNTSSSIVRAIPKGEIVLARPSVSGWMELCSTATTIYAPQQFVSSTYLSKA